MRSERERIQAIADAQTDLHVAAAITALCEASLFRTKTGKRFAEKVGKLSREHNAVQYANFERQMPRPAAEPGGVYDPSQ